MLGADTAYSDHPRKCRHVRGTESAGIRAKGSDDASRGGLSFRELL